MLMIPDAIEQERLKIQSQLNSTKTQLVRNKLGQFATPTVLATEMLEYAQSLILPNLKIRFLDPAIGTGSFFSALLRTFPLAQIEKAVGYEIDTLHSQAATTLWCNTPLELFTNDFTHALAPNTEDTKCNLLICNPPYVRHHHLSTEEKQRLQKIGEQVTGIKLSQQAGLYCYFLYLSHNWMAKNTLAGWLIPSEFMDVNYGQQIKKYLLTKVTLIRVHRFESKDVQFSDALVSSAVVWFVNKAATSNYNVEFTYGGTLAKPETSTIISTDILQQATKWTNFAAMTRKTPIVTNIEVKQKYDISAKVKDKTLLSDIFEIKRGIATGSNDFFLLNQQQIAKYQLPVEFLMPVLPNPRYLKLNEVESDSNGIPRVEQPLFLLTCNLAEEEVKTKYPSLWKYLQLGVDTGISNGYLCSHRKLWYSQEKRPSSMFLCSYMGRQDSKRKKPFRFILNHSKATATNAYHILYPKAHLQSVLASNPQLATLIWLALETITLETLIGEGRTYGGGLHKMEPKELGNVSAEGVFSLIQQYMPLR